MPGGAIPLHTRAMLTRLKLEYGLMSPARAVAWARKLVVEMEDPPYFLAQIAEIQKPAAGELIDLIDGALRGRDEVPALRMLLGGLSVPLQRNPKLAGKFAAVLEKVSRAFVGVLPPDMSNMHLFQGRLDRIAEGQPLDGDAPLRVAADMMDYLKRFAPKG